MIYRYEVTAAGAAYPGSASLTGIVQGRSIAFINMETDAAKVAFISMTGAAEAPGGPSLELIPTVLNALKFTDQKITDIWVRGTGNPRIQIIVED